MIIRQASIKDIDQILQLTNLVADKHGQNRPDIFVEHPYHITRKKLEYNILSPNHFIVVAVNDEKIVGVILCTIRTYSDDIKYRNAKVISIEDTCVDLNFRNNKVGSSMLSYVKDFAKSIGCSRLESNVWAFNHESEKFFVKNGFCLQKMSLEYVIDD